ncbi:MAG: calcium/proton exchanger, partial [Acidobacteria bacterium]|nr:calcium/proton exchanger [Acidobacteriota bacterium]
QSTLLTLAAVSLVIPAAFHHLSGPAGWQQENDLSLEIAAVLLLLYFASLWFSLRTHKDYFRGEGEAAEAVAEHGATWSKSRSFAMLTLATALIAWMSEILVGSVEAAAHTFGMTSLFVGVVVVAVVGNAAEHSTAVLVALKNRMDLSLGIAIGSSVQVALFVAPVLVVVSHFLGPRPMDLVFTPAEVLAVVVSVWIMGQVADDGQSDWLEGALLLGVYLIIAFAFYFLPEGGSHAGVAPAPGTGPAH